MLEKSIKQWTGRSHIVMSITPRVTGDRPIMAIGYKYNHWKFLEFIATEEDGSTDPGDPYLYFFPENYSKVSI